MLPAFKLVFETGACAVMKLNGKTLSEINTDILVFPRKGGDIVLKFAAILDEDEFDKICPLPKVPRIYRAGDTKGEPDFKDKDWLKATSLREDYYSAWVLLKTISATEGLAWDTIDMLKPETWLNVDVELKNAGFNTMERRLITQKVIEVNSLSLAAIERAKKNFFDQQAQAAQNTSSQKAAPTTT